jgi:hypothetical protein
MKPDPTDLRGLPLPASPENYYCAFHSADFAPDGITESIMRTCRTSQASRATRIRRPILARNPISQGTVMRLATAHEFMESITDVYFDAW